MTSQDDLEAEPWPCLTADLPGTGGLIKQELTDFEVDEIPAYEPSGGGDFLFLRVEKRGLSAEQLTSHLARDLQIAHQDIGQAGLKDRQGVTRQWVSVPARVEGLLPRVSHPAIRILEAKRHQNKLRTGHLRGNRFSILIRSVRPDALLRAEAIVARLKESGIPNYFGEQRFGRDAETLVMGQQLLRGEITPAAIPRARRKFLLRLSLSAVQSVLFNETLGERIASGLIHDALAGDVMQVVESRGLFVVDDPVREQPRLDAHEIVPTGPLFGPKMLVPQGEVAAIEAEILASSGLMLEHFEAWKSLTSGARRAFLVWPNDLEVHAEPAGLRVRCTLPSGCYATVLLRELQKD